MAMQQGTQVTLTVPDGAPPGTLLSVPVLGGTKKIKVRVPEGLGAGSTIIIRQMESGEDWDVVVSNVIAYGVEPAYGGESAKEAYLRQQAELEKAWLEQQAEAMDGETAKADPAQEYAVAQAKWEAEQRLAQQEAQAQALLAQQEAQAQALRAQQEVQARAEAEDAAQKRSNELARRAQLAAIEEAKARQAQLEMEQQREQQRLEQQKLEAEEQERLRASEEQRLAALRLAAEKQRLAEETRLAELAAQEQRADQQAIEYVVFEGEQLPVIGDAHLRTLNFHDLHDHAHWLYAKFGHEQIGVAPPNEHTNVIDWILQVQRNLIEPLRVQNGDLEQPLKPAMEAYTVRLETTVGVIDIIVRPDWAPQGTQRFLELAAAGDLNELAFYRAIKGCIVQFGLPAKRQWSAIPDDPPTGVPFLLGAVSFAAVGENSRKSTLFICIGDMSHCLGQNSWETPIGAVAESSLDVLDRIDTTYGDIAEFNGAGPDTTRINTEGSAYLRREFPLLTYIRSARPLDWQIEEPGPTADQAAFASQAAQAAQAAAEAAQAAKQAAQAAMAAQAVQAAEASRGAPVRAVSSAPDGEPFTNPGVLGSQLGTAPMIGVPVEIVTNNRPMPVAAVNAPRPAMMSSAQAVQRYPSLAPQLAQPGVGSGQVVIGTMDQLRPSQVQPMMSAQGARTQGAILPTMAAPVPPTAAGQRPVVQQVMPGSMVQSRQVGGTSLSFTAGGSVLGQVMPQPQVRAVMPMGQQVMGVSPVPSARR